MDKIENILIGLLITFAGFLVVALMVGLSYEGYRAFTADPARDCAMFCGDHGETSYHSDRYGCFCVTTGGRRYNPDAVSPECE